MEILQQAQQPLYIWSEQTILGNAEQPEEKRMGKREFANI